MIVSDNGPQLTSQEFKYYCENQGILHVTSSPYHLRTNGLAERFVRTFKNRITSSDGSPLKRRLSEFLFTYRNTPHTTTGKSPAQMMFGRQLNCVLSNIRPNKRRNLQYQHVKADIASSTPTYQTGDKVYIKTKLEKKWQPATVTTRKHRYSYVVTTSNGVEQRKHADHMRPRLAPAAASPESVVTASTSSPSTCLAPSPMSIPSPSTPPSHIPSTSEPSASTSEPSASTSSASTSSSSSPAFETPTATFAAPLRRSQRDVRPPRRLIEEM